MAGCMRINPGSRSGSSILPHEKTCDPANLPSHGRIGVDDSAALEMPPEAGQASFHKTIRSFELNDVDWPRVGFAAPLAPSGAKQTRERDGACAAKTAAARGSEPDHEMSPESLRTVDEYWRRYKTAMSAQR